jgi:hypothetical protein
VHFRSRREPCAFNTALHSSKAGSVHSGDAVVDGPVVSASGYEKAIFLHAGQSAGW